MWERIRAFCGDHPGLFVILAILLVSYMSGFLVYKLATASETAANQQLESNCPGVIVRGLHGSSTFAVCIPPELVHMLEERER
jgi:hypothetical protein